MTGRVIDLTGQTIGDLVVTERAVNGRSRSGTSIVRFHCRCTACGIEIVKRADCLRLGQGCSACARANIGRRQRGEANPNWRGGYKKAGGGYRAVHAPQSPMSNSKGYVLEHRLVMSEVLGRPLTGDEVVHHRNGDKLDNRPENLELLTHGAHSALETSRRWRELEDLRAEVVELRAQLATHEATA